MRFSLDYKKLSYVFYSLGALLTISLLLAVGGIDSIVSVPGEFLFRSFNFPSFYLPFFLLYYGYLTGRSFLETSEVILLTFSVIPFLTVSLFFRILLSPEGSDILQFLMEHFGRNRSLFLTGSLSILFSFLIFIIPRLFQVSFSEDESGEEEEHSPEEDTIEEDTAFKEYAFRFPDPEEDTETQNKGTSIEDIFTTILSGGKTPGEDVPPLRPENLEPVKDEDLFEDLQSPYIETDPAFAVLSEQKEEPLGDYTYHKHHESVSENQAEEKISEIIAELDSVLATVEDPVVSKPLKNYDPKSVEETKTLKAPQKMSAQEDERDYREEGYLEDRLDELDEFRDISSKLAPEVGDEGGVLKEVKQSQSNKAEYRVPVDGVLAEYPDDKYQEIDEETRKSARVLEVTLEEFKISAKVTGIKKGPVITMFELLPAPGVKISKITNLADNIALRLAASRVRIVAPIPGKHAVGIEVPNKKRGIVSFSEMVSAPEMKDPDTAVPIVLGKDIRGGAQVIDLARTPHLLIAGATGSGKSVCVNSLVCSILFERSPADVKLIMVDPKIVELKLYNDIPHLLTPVITDPKKAIQAIQWCLYEMERRYSLLDSVGVREIKSYNKRIKERNLATTALPYLVLVIDEFADLMATSGKELEAMIARLAAMSRAVGIHLVLATQRPSADVITGLIKANFPSRIAFMVASMTDSRIIIDSPGAEKLLGKGDMLFTSAWDPFPSRVQGAFMSEEEVERVVEYVKTLGAPEYIDDEIFIDDDEADEPSLAGGGSVDPLFNKALEIVSSAGKASASYLQRRLKIGYNRAARLVEQMEDMGIVGPQNGSKPREVLHSHIPESSNY